MIALTALLLIALTGAVFGTIAIFSAIDRIGDELDKISRHIEEGMKGEAR